MRPRHGPASPRLRVFTLLALLGALACLPSCGGGRAPNHADSGHDRDAGDPEAARALHALFESAWAARMADSPQWASSLGDHRYDDRWDDVSLSAFARREARDREQLAALGRIDRARLGREDALSHDLFRRELELAIEGAPFRLHLLPVNQRGGIQTADELVDELPFDTLESFTKYNQRLATFPRYMDQTLALLEEGVRVGLVQPRLVMQRVVAQIDAQIAKDPTKSPFYAPYRKARERSGAPKLDVARHDAEARRLIETTVVPAFVKMRAFFVDRYLPACRAGFGAWELPDGAALYAHLAKRHTTTSMTPDEIHAVGLREVARIRGAMEEAKRRAGFAGTLAELFTFLRTDPRFYFERGEDLLAAYRVLSKQVDPLLVKLFGRLPRTPYGVEPIPDAVAPDTTTAYYREPAADGSRAGTYFVNLYKPEVRPRWEMTALTLHEAVPGHHLQIALAMENERIPKFRRHGEYNAFVEGWALYAESLGEELGLYEDPYAKLGQLTYEMWRAVRLVVDTGIHHLRWDRQRAIDFFLENAAKTEHDVTNEVDRYIVWPGQALGYKLGELRIKELRAKEEARLGARFDVRRFHETVLRAGPLPLDLLEREISSAR